MNPVVNKDRASHSPPTLHDVARLAGVSPSTVSRILNGQVRVSADKRQAVELAIERLGFRPNLSARGLRSGSTRTIGILVQDLESPYFTGGSHGVEEGLLGSGFAPLVVPGHWNPEEELDRVHLLMSRKVDALIILGGTLRDDQIAEIAQRQPVAVTGRQLQAPNVHSFHFDQVAGGMLATQHLIDLGHRHIAHIAGPASHRDAVDRREGFLAAHRTAGLSVDPRLIVQSNFLEAGGEAALQRLLAEGRRFTAVFCANDQTLWGARLALFRHGLKVPEQVSLVGFDDMPQSTFMTPPVTTVRQPMHELGRAAARAVLGALGVQVDVARPPEQLRLMVRESTTTPAKST